MQGMNHEITRSGDHTTEHGNRAEILGLGLVPILFHIFYLPKGIDVQRMKLWLLDTTSYGIHSNIK